MFQFSKKGKKVEPIPRLVSAQTCKDGETSAIYRMPGCNQSNINTEQWSPTVRKVCEAASEYIDQQLNHCVCTLYRNQDDSLAFHTDKLLDLKENSLILSISFGAPRPIVFEEIHGKGKQTVILHPGSLLAIGPKTNTRWKHSIPKLKEPVAPRVSLSIRTIETFVDKMDKTVTGKGSEYQDVNYPFITSYDDMSNYSDDVQKFIRSHEAECEEWLNNLRK